MTKVRRAHAMTDAELVRFATDFREGILDGKRSVWMCFAICAPLVTLLNLSGVKTDLMESDHGAFNHYWLRLVDGRALDPTADQFANYPFAALGLMGLEPMPPVYLGPPVKVHHNAKVA